MARHALIRTSTGTVENVIELESPHPTWAPPAGCETRPSENANIGDVWDGKQFVTPRAELVVDAIGALKLEYATAATVDQKLAILARAVGVAE